MILYKKYDDLTQAEIDNAYECISKEQPDMDILWSHLNCILSRILHVRYLLGEMLDPYTPELYDGKEITDYIDNKTLIDINTLTKKYIVHIK